MRCRKSFEKLHFENYRGDRTKRQSVLANNRRERERERERGKGNAETWARR